jgi:hypothetical protein
MGRVREAVGNGCPREAHQEGVGSLSYEYATTYGQFVSFFEGELEREPDAPKPPAGDGWELVCMTASSHWLYWSWRRKVSAPEKPAVQP